MAIHATYSFRYLRQAYGQEVDLAAEVGIRELSPGFSYRFLHPAYSFRALHAESVSLAVPNIYILTDSVTFGETLTYSLDRNIAEAALISDVFSVSVSIPRAETLTVSDAAALTVATPISDSYALSEAFTFSAGKAADESLTFSDSAITSIGFGVLPTESVSFSELQTFGIAQSITDTFTLDDFSQIDKQAFGIKTNITTMQDSIVIVPFYSSALFNKPLIGASILNSA